MHKKKNGKSARQEITFPAGYRCLKIGHEGTDPSTVMGHMNLILIKSEDRAEYFGAIKFEHDDQFGNLSKKPFPLLVNFDPCNGGIRFQVVGATQVLDPNNEVPLEFHFEFSGFYSESDDEITGDGGVPANFYPRPDSSGKLESGPQDEGQTVTWLSGGVMDPDTKPSK
jgi:hypothetical protein